MMQIMQLLPKISACGLFKLNKAIYPTVYIYTLEIYNRFRSRGLNKLLIFLIAVVWCYFNLFLYAIPVSVT